MNSVAEEEDEIQFPGKNEKRGSVAQLRDEFNSLKEDIALLRSEIKNIVKPPTSENAAPKPPPPQEEKAPLPHTLPAEPKEDEDEE